MEGKIRKLKFQIFKYFLFIIGVVSLLSSFVSAEETSSSMIHVLLSQIEDIHSEGDLNYLVAELKIDKGFHTYWKNPGESGAPLEIKAHLKGKAKIEDIDWPTPVLFQEGGVTGFGYSDTAYFILKLKNGKEALQEPMTLTFSGIACSSEACVPFKSEGVLELKEKLSSEEKEKGKALLEKAEKEQPLQDLTEVFNSINAQKKEKNIELRFQGEGLSDKAYFFPEEDGFEVGNLPIKGEKENEKILLKLPYDGSTKNLKGVVVVEKNGRSESMCINIPLNSDDSNYLAENTVPYAPLEEIDPSFLFIISTLFFAFIGGMILNLMPCVLPVLSLKVMSFIKMKEKGQREVYKSAGLFTLGVLVSFWFLVGLMLLLKSYGRSVGWGFQLQEPWFVAVLGAIFFVFALSLFGFFEIGLSFASKAGEMEAKARKGYKGKENIQSFCSGVLATFVATPCTGPFLGSAIGIAFTLPWYISFLIFTFLGLGMSFPYLLFAFFPSLLKLVPKPGNWMENFKKGMGLILLATAFWLFTVFAAETSWINSAIVIFSLSLILFGVYLHTNKRRMERLISLITLATFLVGIFGIGFALKNPYAFATPEEDLSADGWESFSYEKIKMLDEKGIPYFIDFTAKWCLICQANHRVLTEMKVEEKIMEKGIVRLKADWTKNDPKITKELEKYGRNSVPLYIFKEKGKEAKILPQVLTQEAVLSALEENDR